GAGFVRRGFRKRTDLTKNLSTTINVVLVTDNSGRQYPFPDVEHAYRRSHNIALLMEALRYCSVANCCPAWLAQELVRLLAAEQKGPGNIARWRRRHERDLVELYQTLVFAEGLGRHDFSRARAELYARDLMAGTRATGSPSTFSTSYKKVH